jgi:phosphoribosylaminoimidazole carboxylase
MATSPPTSPFIPGARTLGILGGGQLGRMLTEAAVRLGVRVIALDPTPSCPAAQVGAEQLVGSFTDAARVAELAARCDVLTVEIEHVNAAALRGLGARCRVEPAPETLALVQDKLLQKRAMRAAGVPLGDFVEVAAVEDVLRAAEAFGGFPLMLKSRCLAYDGRGNAVVRDAAGAAPAFAQLAEKGALYAERWVDFRRELAVVVARAAVAEGAAPESAAVECYDAVETVQRDSICHVVVAPAQVPGAVLERARQVAAQAVGQLRGAGVFGVELFELADGTVLFNEVAPRVHNSGHFSIEACHTSQFEQHVRAVMGLPLGSAALRVGAAVMVNVLGAGGASEADVARTWDICQRALAVPGASAHWYGKHGGVARGRKVGHVTLTGEWMPDVLRTAAALIDGAGPAGVAGGAAAPRPACAGAASGAAGDAAAPAAEPASARAALWARGLAPVVGIIMGSDSDLPTMQAAAATLEEFGVPFELTVVSAHRTPRRLVEYASSARARGLKVIIAAAGGAAHLPGMVAALTPLPVIGVPVALKQLDGVDSLYSIVQMPRGVPVATVAINNSTNGALLAIRMLGGFVPSLGDAMEAYQRRIEGEVLEKAEKLERVGWKAYSA